MIPEDSNFPPNYLCERRYEKVLKNCKLEHLASQTRFVQNWKPDHRSCKNLVFIILYENSEHWPINTHDRRPVLSEWVVGVRGTGYGQPVRGALKYCEIGGSLLVIVTYPCAYLAASIAGSWYWEWLGRGVDGVRAGSVLDTAEVPLHAHADAVVGVGQLEPCGVIVVEGEHLAWHPSEVL